jgi:ArsR family transcriptional regulator, zinc-responsive transcriptional repressor
MPNHNGHIQDMARLFRILADPTRLRILMELQNGQQNVGQLCRKLGMAQPTVSHHLGLLRMGELVATRRSGKAVFYSVYDPAKGHRADSVRSLLKKAPGLRLGPLALGLA